MATHLQCFLYYISSPVLLDANQTFTKTQQYPNIMIRIVFKFRILRSSLFHLVINLTVNFFFLMCHKRSKHYIEGKRFFCLARLFSHGKFLQSKNVFIDTMENNNYMILATINLSQANVLLLYLLKTIENRDCI